MAKGKAATKELLPVALGAGKVRYAQGIAAGPWVFATGHMGQNFRDGIAPEVLSSGLPYRGRPKVQKEAELIFDHIGAVLKEGGSGLEHVVRLDQYYPRHEAVDPYHLVRKRRLTGGIAASTSILVSELLLPRAEVDVQCIGIRPGKGLKVEHFNDPLLSGHASSGFSAAVRAGDFVFVPGIVASALPGKPARRVMAVEAVVPEGTLWRGFPIRLETEYVLKTKIEPALALAGASLKSVVKAQAYLTHLDDVGHFLDVWRKHFPTDPPALTIVVCNDPAIGTYEARLEVNVLAVVDGAKIKRQIVKADVPSAFDGVPAAVRCGDLLFLSGLYAIDDDGLIAGAKVDPRQPHFGSTVQAQTQAILAQAEKICAAAGTSLANVVRIQQFHTRIGDFYQSYRAWEEHLPGRAFPFSAIQVAPTMPVPDATLMMDLWVYVP
jgi:enamine deaminase RidA (YjgF/YER057c/UK114 family)